MRRSSSFAVRRPSSVAAIVVMTIVALSLPLSLALATSAFAQEPNPPTGGPQEPTGTDTTPTTTSPTGGQQPTTTTGQLPRTGWDALLYFALGAGLLLAGASPAGADPASRPWCSAYAAATPRSRCARHSSRSGRPA